MFRRFPVASFFLLFGVLLTFPFLGCECYIYIPSEPRQKQERPHEEILAEEAPPEETIPEGPPPEMCPEGAKEPCDTGQAGVCQSGERICLQGRWGKCNRREQPSAELCDRLDNDCDGKIDEDLKRKCPYSGPPGTEGIAACRAGEQICTIGAWGDCKGEVLPTPEVCNEKDDNCNGAIDEFLPIQAIGVARNYSNQGDYSHLYMTSNPTGYAFAWSERPQDQPGGGVIKLTRIGVNGGRTGGDWTISQNSNIHGLAWTGSAYGVAWDNDQSRGSNVSDAFLALVDPSGKTIAGPRELERGGRAANTNVAYGPNVFAASWIRYLDEQNGFSGFVRLQMLDPKLGLIGSITPTSTDYSVSPVACPFPAMAFTKTEFLMAWVTPERTLRLGRFDLQGKSLGFSTIPNPGAEPRDPVLAGFDDGYTLIWNDLNNVPDQGTLYSQRLDALGKPVGTRHVLSQDGARTPTLKTTSFGSVVAWIQLQTNRRGISIARIDRDGKLLAPPSWTSVPTVLDYLALAWTDLGQGQGRGAIAWIEETQNLFRVMVAPLGCR